MITPTRARSLGLDRTTLAHFARSVADRALHAIAYFSLCLQVARERRQLRNFDTRALKDIGLSRADAQREADRGFWDIPEHRRTDLTGKPATYRTGSGPVPLVRAIQR